MSALERQTVKAPTSREDMIKWANKTLDEITAEHTGHYPAYMDGCRGCIIRAIHNVAQDVRAVAHIERAKASKGIAYLNSVIQQYNMAEMGVDYVAPFAEV